MSNKKTLFEKLLQKEIQLKQRLRKLEKLSKEVSKVTGTNNLDKISEKKINELLGKLNNLN